jgi:hypothetical protein
LEVGVKMKCECGGILNVIAVEEPPADLAKEQKLIYDRVCDVECLSCGKIYYSQPYDFGKRINAVKGTMKKV